MGLALEQPGHKPQSFVHHRTLHPRHRHPRQCERCYYVSVRFVTYVSGRSLQCPVPQGSRTSFGSLSQDKYCRELTFQFYSDLAISRDDADLLDQAAHDLESLTAVVRIAEGCVKSFDLGAVDCRQIWMQERLVFGCRARRPAWRHDCGSSRQAARSSNPGALHLIGGKKGLSSHRLSNPPSNAYRKPSPKSGCGTTVTPTLNSYVQQYELPRLSRRACVTLLAVAFRVTPHPRCCS